MPKYPRETFERIHRLTMQRAVATGLLPEVVPLSLSVDNWNAMAMLLQAAFAELGIEFEKAPKPPPEKPVRPQVEYIRDV